MSRKKTAGVLALQGDFDAHCKALDQAGADAREVRTAADLDHIDGLIIPGGESTTMLKMLEYDNLFEPLAEFGRRRPVFGTCAGAILIARSVLNPAQKSMSLMNIEVERNGYGRQLDSRIVRLALDTGVLEGDNEMEAVFIRAPIIRQAGPEVKVLASYQNQPVFAEQGRHLVATFHPELTQDVRVHRYFVEKL